MDGWTSNDSLFYELRLQRCNSDGALASPVNKDVKSYIIIIMKY